MSNKQRCALLKKRVGVQRFKTIPACSSDVIDVSHVRRCILSATLEGYFRVPRIVRFCIKMKSIVLMLMASAAIAAPLRGTYSLTMLVLFYISILITTCC